MFPDAACLDNRSGSFKDVIRKSSQNDALNTDVFEPFMDSRGIPARKMIIYQPEARAWTMSEQNIDI